MDTTDSAPARLSAPAPVTSDDAVRIIAEEGMDVASVGPACCLVLTDDGQLSDDWASAPADLSSEDAFRAQVRAWKAAVMA